MGSKSSALLWSVLVVAHGTSLFRRIGDLLTQDVDLNFEALDVRILPVDNFILCPDLLLEVGDLLLHALDAHKDSPVSYTHLTLPTIYSV